MINQQDINQREFEQDRLRYKLPQMRMLMLLSTVLFALFGLRDAVLGQGILGLPGLIRYTGVTIMALCWWKAYRVAPQRVPALVATLLLTASVSLSLVITQRPEGPVYSFPAFMIFIMANVVLWSNLRHLVVTTMALSVPPFIMLWAVDASTIAWTNYIAFIGLAVTTGAYLFHILRSSDLDNYQLRVMLENRSQSDFLTGVLNRAGWNNRAMLLVKDSNQRNRPVSMLFIDIDHFKRINDERGHVAGDEVLEAIARLLPTCLRGVDMIARLGGEEFVVLMPGATQDVANRVAERVRIQVEEHFKKFTVTVSIGVAQLASGETLEQLQVRADAAMYQAKRNGRNRTELAAVA